MPYFLSRHGFLVKKRIFSRKKRIFAQQRTKTTLFNTDVQYQIYRKRNTIYEETFLRNFDLPTP